MKKIFSHLIFLIFILSSCSSPFQIKKNKIINLINDEKYYLTATSKITDIFYDDDNDFCYLSFEQMNAESQNTSKIKYCIVNRLDHEIFAGDTVTFVYLNHSLFDNDMLYIISLQKNDIEILSIESGKRNLIEWVEQIRFK